MMHQVTIGLMQCYLRALIISCSQVMQGMDSETDPYEEELEEVRRHPYDHPWSDSDDVGEAEGDASSDEGTRLLQYGRLRPCQCSHGDHHCTRRVRTLLPLGHTGQVLCHRCVPCNDETCLRDHPTAARAHCIQSETCLHRPLPWGPAEMRVLRRVRRHE